MKFLLRQHLQFLYSFHSREGFDLEYESIIYISLLFLSILAITNPVPQFQASAKTATAARAPPNASAATATCHRPTRATGNRPGAGPPPSPRAPPAGRSTTTGASTPRRNTTTTTPTDPGVTSTRARGRGRGQPGSRRGIGRPSA